ncbi:MAG: Dabb family protein [Nibricoccus sp.]
MIEKPALMIIHSVFFWLKPELTDAQRTGFVAAAETFRTIPSVQSLFVGRPAPIVPRPVVDGSYTFALSITFKDIAGHDAYQIDPTHRAFVDKNKTAVGQGSDLRRGQLNGAIYPKLVRTFQKRRVLYAPPLILLGILDAVAAS